jgi:hypothetical protein
MTEKKMLDPARMDVVIAVLIALISLTTALAAWRTNAVGSNAAEADRQGLMNALTKGRLQNDNWRDLYGEAEYAVSLAVESAATEAMEVSEDETLRATAKYIRESLLVSLQIHSDPLGTQEKYSKSDGSFDIEKRFADMAVESDVNTFDPAPSFELADRYAYEQRWLTVGTMLLAISLFWLGLAEILSGRGRIINLTLGVGIYLLGLLFFCIVEVIAIVGRGGVL